MVHIVRLPACSFATLAGELLEELLRDLLDLLILLHFLLDLIILLGKKCSLPLDDLTNLLLLVIGQFDLALVEQGAHELAALDLLGQLPLADVEELVALFTNNGVVVRLALLLLSSSSLSVQRIARLFLNHPIHGDIHRLWSV